MRQLCGNGFIDYLMKNLVEFSKFGIMQTKQVIFVYIYTVCHGIWKV